MSFKFYNNLLKTQSYLKQYLPCSEDINLFKSIKDIPNKETYPYLYRWYHNIQEISNDIMHFNNMNNFNIDNNDLKHNKSPSSFFCGGWHDLLSHIMSLPHIPHINNIGFDVGGVLCRKDNTLNGELLPPDKEAINTVQ